MQLQINHVGWRGKSPLFEIIRKADLKHTNAVPLRSPAIFPIIGHPTELLLPNLRWYIEDYLQTPFGAYPEKAESVRKTIQAWGMEIFNTLFVGYARDWYQTAKRDNSPKFSITITSDSPEVISWPWEALYSQEDGFLALHCLMERQLCTISDPSPLSENLSKNNIHILYVIARPQSDQDIDYQLLVGSLVAYSSKDAPVTIDILRPPTFDQLRKVLHECPGYYHIVHFDGHGDYTTEGCLIFETTRGEPEPIEATCLAQLLAECNIPVMVMNACRSGMIDGQAQSSFSSVAASLLQAGIHSVVAMSYSLYANGAEEFFSEFYKQIFSGNSVSEAVRAGRLQMFRQPKRACVIGREKLADWLVPVLYQNIPPEQDVISTIRPDRTALPKVNYLPEDAFQLGDYGLIGRGNAIHKIERAMIQQPQAGILIHGQAGIGKTTLAKGFLQWFQHTGGLCAPVLLFNFQEIHSIEFIIDQLAKAYMLSDITDKSLDQKIELLSNIMQNHPYLLVWDNFESVSGIDGTEITPQLPKEDREKLTNLLKKLRNGKTKILIVSRAKEDWLPIQCCYSIQLDGLAGEELWEYCNTVVRDLGLNLDRRNKTYQSILEKLCGNPLIIRAILLRLNECSAEDLLKELEVSVQGIDEDLCAKHLQAAFSAFGKDLLKRYRLTLEATGLFDRHLDIHQIEIILSSLDVSGNERDIITCYNILEKAGFCTSMGRGMFRIHPALSSYLQGNSPAAEETQKEFVRVFSLFSDEIVKKPLYMVKQLYKANLSNLYQAKEIANTFKMNTDFITITQALAIYTQEQRQFQEAAELHQAIIEKAKLIGNLKKTAETYHQLGIIAMEQRGFVESQSFCIQALTLYEELKDENGIANIYHQLGRIAEAQRNFVLAKAWYQVSLVINEKNENQLEAAKTYHQLGVIAQEEKNFTIAESWYKRSLDNREKHGDEDGIARTYHQLGILAQKKTPPANSEAKFYYKKSLVIEKRHGNTYRVAMSYHQLGRLAQEEHDFTAAETWYQSALSAAEKCGDKYGAAITCHQLGVLAHIQHDYLSAANFYLKAILVLTSQNDQYSLNLSISNYARLLHSASPSEKKAIRELWMMHISPKLTAQLNRAEESLNGNK